MTETTMTLHDPKNGLVHIVKNHDDRGYNGMMFYFVCGGDCHGERWKLPAYPFEVATCLQCVART